MYKFISMSLLTLAIGLPQTASAELERLPSTTVVPDKKALVKNKSISIYNNTLNEHKLDKNKLFRCWQYGQLIVAENGFNTPGPDGKVLLSKGGTRLTGFDFGETFCIYMGD